MAAEHIEQLTPGRRRRWRVPGLLAVISVLISSLATASPAVAGEGIGSGPEVQSISSWAYATGTGTAELMGQGLLATERFGQQLPGFTTMCAQWRPVGAESWSEQCRELFVSVEFRTGCENTNEEQVFCVEVFSISELEPGTEYESRATLSSMGEEVDTSVESFTTEGQGPPSVVSAPQLSGNWHVGETVEVTTPATWLGIEPFTYAETWELCVAETCNPIPASEAPSYRIPAEDVVRAGESPHVLRYEQTATNGHGSASVLSEQHEVLALPAVFTTGSPVLEGEAEVGDSLTLTHYEVGGDPAPAVTLSWERCDSAGSECKAIAGASGTTYRLSEQDAEHTIRAIVQASNTEYLGGSAVSEQTPVTAIVGPASGGSAPANTELPQLQPQEGGAYAVGASLEGSDGAWQSQGATTTFAYQWLRCDAAGGSCQQIAGATESSYVPTAADLMHTLRLSVTAQDGAGETVAQSAASPLIPEVSEVTTIPPEQTGPGEATVTGTVTLVGEAGDTVPLGAEGCAQLRQVGAGSWSQQCVPVQAGACTQAGEETLECTISVASAGLLGGLEYEYRFVVHADGEEKAGSGGTFTQPSQPCGPGSYSLTGNEPCTQATPGHYVQESAATGQTDCPAGSHDEETASTSSSDCLPDAPGSYSGAGAAAATLCDAGSYSAISGASSCTPAGLGHYVASTGAEQQLPCPAGSFAEVTGSSLCLTTPPDTYSTGAAVKPTPCPTGTESHAGASSCTAKPSQPTEEVPVGTIEATSQSTGTSPEADAQTSPAQPEHTAGGTGRTPRPAPVLSGFSIKHACISPAVSARGARHSKRRPKGPSVIFMFRLSEAAQITYTVSRRDGSRAPMRCPTGAKRSAGAGRYKRISTGTTAHRGGANSQTLTAGQLAAHAHKLTPGVYQLTVTATNAEGARSTAARLNFWVGGGPRKR